MLTDELGFNYRKQQQDFSFFTQAMDNVVCLPKGKEATAWSLALTHKVQSKWCYTTTPLFTG